MRSKVLLDCSGANAGDRGRLLRRPTPPPPSAARTTPAVAPHYPTTTADLTKHPKRSVAHDSRIRLASFTLAPRIVPDDAPRHHQPHVRCGAAE
jgi:hypothetical protein